MRVLISPRSCQFKKYSDPSMCQLVLYCGFDCIFLVNDSIKHLFMSLFVICRSFLEKCLFKILCHFLKRGYHDLFSHLTKYLHISLDLLLHKTLHFSITNSYFKWHVLILFSSNFCYKQRYSQATFSTHV